MWYRHPKALTTLKGIFKILLHTPERPVASTWQTQTFKTFSRGGSRTNVTTRKSNKGSLRLLIMNKYPNHSKYLGKQTNNYMRKNWDQLNVFYKNKLLNNSRQFENKLFGRKKRITSVIKAIKSCFQRIWTIIVSIVSK